MTRPCLTPAIIAVILVFSLLAGNPLHAAQPADQQIAAMTLNQKIGQLLMIGVSGRDIGEREASHIRNLQPGGIVFFSRNFSDAADLSPLIARIKTLCGNKGLPLFFAIDQEGGIVHRIMGSYHRPPSAPAIGAAGSEDIAREVGLSVGSTLSETGINVNLAPVLDVPADPASPMTMRSFDSDAGTVARLGVAYMAGMRDAGLFAAAKHFPGLGRALEDSHLKMPRVVWRSREEKEHDLLPFRAAAAAGADMIMAGHFLATPGDPDNPVSLSSYWLGTVLREEVGFRGLVIVDNLEMKAIEDSIPVAEAAVRSFLAGADIILVSHETRNQQAVFQALADAVRKGVIPEERLNESVRRIIDNKKKMAAKKPMGTPAGLGDISRSVARRYVTALTRKDAAFTPLRRGHPVLFAGTNMTLFTVLKEALGPAGILNSPLRQFETMNPGVTAAGFIRRFEAVVIDADYRDAASVIKLCEEHSINYFVVQSHLPAIRRTIDTLRPKQILLAHEMNIACYRAGIEIMSGERRATARLPFRIPLPKGYTYPITDR